MRVVMSRPHAIRAPPVGCARAHVEAGALEVGRVFTAQPGEHRPIAQENPRTVTLVRAEHVRLADVEPAEMEEAQRHAIDSIAVAVERQLPAVQVPIRDVVAGILEDRVIEKLGTKSTHR